MVIDPHVIERWAEEFRPAILQSERPDEEAAAIDNALSRDGNQSQRLGMWLALLDVPSTVQQHEALRGIARVLAEIDGIDAPTAAMLLGRMSADDFWYQPFAVPMCTRIAGRLVTLEPGVADEVVGYGLRVVARYAERSEGIDLVGKHAPMRERNIQRLCAELPLLDRTSLVSLLDVLEDRMRTEDPDMFVPYVEGLMTWWDTFDEASREILKQRLVPILNTEILRDFTKISAKKFERATNAIGNAEQMDDELRRNLIRELVPHSRDLADRQPVSPPLRARLEADDESVLDQVFENANVLDPLAAAGFLINVIDVLKTSPMRFTFAERMLRTYAEWDIVRRAATIDVVGREMWRFLGRYADVNPVDVEGLAEASEPFIDVVEMELVDHLRGELDALRLASFPRV